jgi:hypothetical protein
VGAYWEAVRTTSRESRVKRSTAIWIALASGVLAAAARTGELGWQRAASDWLSVLGTSAIGAVLVQLGLVALDYLRTPRAIYLEQAKTLDARDATIASLQAQLAGRQRDQAIADQLTALSNRAHREILNVTTETVYPKSGVSDRDASAWHATIAAWRADVLALMVALNCTAQEHAQMWNIPLGNAANTNRFVFTENQAWTEVQQQVYALDSLAQKYASPLI